MLNRRNMFDHRKDARKKMMAFVPVYNLQLNVLLGYLVDLTVHGAKVEGAHPARINQQLKLGIEFPEDLPESVPSPFKIDARVVRCTRDEDTQNYSVGIEFKGINPRQERAIEAIIKRYAFHSVVEE